MQVPRQVKMDLTCAYGVFKITDANVTESINSGVSWSCSIVSHDLDVMALPENLFLTISIKEMIGETVIEEYLSPPLVCEEMNRSHTLSGQFASLTGIDKSTWLLSKDDLSLDTFINSSTTAIISRCCLTEVGAVVNGIENMPIADDDVKNSKILDVLSRYLAVTGQSWKVERDGSISCFSAAYTGPVNEDFRYTSISDKITRSARVDSLKIEKTSKVATAEEVCFRFDSVGFKTVQLPQPLYRATPIDRSSYGFIELVTTFNGSTQGPVTGIFPFVDNVIVTTGPQDSSLPSNVATLVVREPLTIIGTTRIDAKVCFSGNPVPPDQPNATIPSQHAFRRLLSMSPPSGATGPRPSRDIWTDTLIPSAAWVDSHKHAYMIEQNKGYHPMSAEAVLTLSASLAQGFTSPGFPTGRIESFTHSVSSKSSSATTSVRGFVPYPAAPELITIATF